MGISLQSCRLLMKARSRGLDLGRTATLGRLRINMSPQLLASVLAEGRVRLTLTEAQVLMEEQDRYAEPLFRHLGAQELHTFDASAYEGATYIHDFNNPIPEEHHNRYSTVIDSGSLEHIFNFPAAIANLMKMIEPGGHLIISTPANNALGHGFYQFSPELFFRVLSPENNFEMCCLYLVEGDRQFWHRVTDPAVIGQRLERKTRGLTSVALIARKLRPGEILSATPQQSDYQTEWDNADRETEPSKKEEPSALKRLVRALVPSAIRIQVAHLRIWWSKRATENRAFRRVHWTDS